MQGPRHILSRQTAAHHLASINARVAQHNGNRVKNADYRVLKVICGLAGSKNKSHCYPSQATLLRLLKAFTGRVMSRRTLNRHLGRLEDEQYIRRIRRHKRHPINGFEFHSTCYVPRWHVCRLMAKDAVAIFQLLATQLGPFPSIRVTKMAQYLNRFYKSVITAPP